MQQRLQSRVPLAHYGYGERAGVPAYEVWIYRNGDVEFRGLDLVKTRGDASGTIEPVLVEVIDKLVGEAGLANLGIVRRDHYRAPLYWHLSDALTYWDASGVSYDDQGHVRDDRMAKTDYDAVQEQMREEHRRVEIVKAALDLVASIDRWAGTLEERAQHVRERRRQEAERAREEIAFAAKIDRCEADSGTPLALSLPSQTWGFWGKLTNRREECLDTAALEAAGEQRLVPEKGVETYRIFYWPCFGPHAVARLERRNGRAKLFAVRLDSAGCFGPRETQGFPPPGEVHRMSAELSPAEWREIAASLDKIHFWRPEEDAPKPCDGCILMDPDACVIEGSRNEEQRVRLDQLNHAVEDEAGFFSACAAILRPTKFKLRILREPELRPAQ